MAGKNYFDINKNKSFFASLYFSLLKVFVEIQNEFKSNKQ